MKRRSTIPLLLLLLLLSGCNSLRRPAPAVDRSRDAELQQAVAARLAQQSALDPASLRVEVDGAVVTLHGSVPGFSAWQCAVRTAQLVPGVRSVTDFLVITPGPREVSCIVDRGETTILDRTRSSLTILFFHSFYDARQPEVAAAPGEAITAITRSPP